ncbi:MAG: hypothetical protein JWP97_1224 [Labilithrix sp.]|nr:hypothetical protein [Labilithrix sp.]
MRLGRSALLACAMAVPVLVGGTARAQAPVASGPDADYRKLVDEALMEYDGGRFEEALALFEQAHATRPSARAKRGMAKALFELRAYVRCTMVIDEALAATVDPLPESLRADVLALRDRALRFVGRVAIDVTPATAHVLVDGRPIVRGADGLAALEVGAHVIEVSAPAHEPARRTLDVRAATTVRVALALVPVREETSREAPPSKVIPVTLLVGAGALALAGTVTSSLWLSDRASAIDRCTVAAARGAPCANASGIESQRDMAAATIALSSAAVVASAVGLYVVLRHGDAAVRAGCAPQTGGASCMLRSTW